MIIVPHTEKPVYSAYGGCSDRKLKTFNYQQHGIQSGWSARSGATKGPVSKRALYSPFTNQVGRIYNYNYYPIAYN